MWDFISDWDIIYDFIDDCYFLRSWKVLEAWILKITSAPKLFAYFFQICLSSIKYPNSIAFGVFSSDLVMIPTIL